MLSTSRHIVPYNDDWSTKINYLLHNEAKSKNLIHMNTYTPIDLKGFYTHGIKTKLQVLMNILKSGEILSQNKINGKKSKVSQHTSYIGSEKDRISFSMFGDGNISELYGKGGITLISNKINTIRAKSHMQYEWFCYNSVPIEDFIIAIDIKFAETHILDLDAKQIFYWEYRDNNYNIMLKIIQFLQQESNIPMMRTLYGNSFDSLSSISSSSSVEYDDDDIDELSFEEFKIYYTLVLERLIEEDNEFAHNYVLNLVIALLKKYNLEHIKIILVDYEKEETD